MRLGLAISSLALVLGACATQAPERTLDGYKKTVALRVLETTLGVYCEPRSEMLKSVVVLDITVDREGNLVDAWIYRSNGFEDLDSRALESVVRAAPFAAPAPELVSGRASLTFLETFLFRDDECFHIRSLVEAAA